MEETPYDSIYEPRGYGRPCTLHFLDTGSKSVITYRCLVLEHRPAGYVGTRIETPLDALLVAPDTGQFVHPGEHEKLLVARRKEQERKEREAREREETKRRQAEARKRGREAWSSTNAPLVQPRQFREQAVSPPHPHPVLATDLVVSRRQPDAPCELCGRMTPERDQTVYDGLTGACKCRECMGVPPRPPA